GARHVERVLGRGGADAHVHPAAGRVGGANAPQHNGVAGGNRSICADGGGVGETVHCGGGIGADERTVGTGGGKRECTIDSSLVSDRRVVAPRGVREERQFAAGRVVAPRGVRDERQGAVGGVPTARGQGLQG